ncbi:hypothetical protein DY000_02013331 [Brassica cretica]|uniref:Uncharacterized protein n=1 Tax=Brassica cretica TaxID=69181 RepID=A0ABQ7CQI6_BRACR|nr:hypothetical protein DY000_02013331 [Brassica cretica]
MFNLPNTAMANSFILLANLKAGHCSNTAEFRLLRFSVVEDHWTPRRVVETFKHRGPLDSA